MEVKKYRFFEALDKIVGTGRRIKHTGLHSLWLSYDGDNGIGLTDSNNESVRWPSVDQQKEKIWKIEPDEIYVWGRDEENNDSWIFTHGIPHSDTNQTLVPCEDMDGRGSCFKKGLFQKDKYQKYKLVLVEHK